MPNVITKRERGCVVKKNIHELLVFNKKAIKGINANSNNKQQTQNITDFTYMAE
jgi:hypothetical protein